MEKKMRLFKFLFLEALLIFSTTSSLVSKEINFQRISTKVLEETNEIFWNSIYSVAFSPNGKYLAICSNSNNKYVGIYNLNDFKLHKTIIAEPEYSDSVIPQIKYFRNDYKIVPAEYKKYYPTFENTFKYVQFQSDSLLSICSYINYATIPVGDNYENPTKKNSSSVTAIVNHNLRNNNNQYVVFNVTSMQDSTLLFPLNYRFIFNNNSYYFPTSSKVKNISVAEYAKNGEYRDKTHQFPDIMVQTPLLTSITYDPRIVLNNKDEMIVAYPYVATVYNASSKTEFELKDLKFSNNELLKRINLDRKYAKEIRDSIFRMLKFTISQIFVDNKNRIILQYEYYEEKEGKPIITPYIQVYSQDGELLAGQEIDYKNDKGKLYFLTFDKNSDKFYFFRKGETVWTVEEFDWAIK